MREESEIPFLTRNRTWLAEQGWKTGRVSQLDSCDFVWYRRYPDAPRCCLNENKPGIQVCLMMWDFGQHASFQVDIRGELLDGTPVELKAFSIPARDLIEILDGQVAKMLRAWTVVNQEEN